MNIKEFAALKVGDRIANPMAGTAGTVTDTDEGGITVRWDGTDNSLTRYYGAVTTAWMHWAVSSKAED
jgi:hypothetical protein